MGLKNTLSWVLWGIGVLGEGHATPSETKKETPGTPHSAYGSLSLPAGDLNEGRSFLNEFRYIPHELLFCAHQFPPLLVLLILVGNLLLLEIIVGQLFEFQGSRERFVELLERQFS